jgi:hypothetical protein
VDATNHLNPHVYLSTGCLHGHHDYCNCMVGVTGEKRPGRCKFCDAPCTCECHRISDLSPGQFERLVDFLQARSKQGNTGLETGRDTMEDITELAKRAYTAYGSVTGFKNYQGNPMPEWDNLGETIQAAWCAAVRNVLGNVDSDQP